MELDYRAAEANTCTIETTAGYFLEIGASPEEVLAAIDVARENQREAEGNGFVALPRLVIGGRSDSNYRRMVWIFWSKISCILPLDERPSPLREATRAQPSEVS